MKQLDKLLFEQGGDCFFCSKPLAKADASIEHLFAQANGGPNANENVVACCKTLNALLSNRPLKDKFQIVLRQKGPFRCPAERCSPASESPSDAAQGVSQAAIPKNIESSDGNNGNEALPVASSYAAALHETGGDSNLKGEAPMLTVKCPTCRASVSKTRGQIDFRCQRCDGAFRY